jgi:protein-disulfide isomerase
MANDEPNQSNSGPHQVAGGAGSANRRQIVLGAAAIIVIGIAGGAYYLWPQAALPELKAAPKQPDADPKLMAELMQPEALPDIALGSAKAPVTIVEYASLGCSHCAHFNEATFPDLKKRYIDTGKVRYILRDFPLDDTAAMAFVFAHCAGNGDSNKYFSIVDTLFRQQPTWYVNDPTAPLMAIAKQAGFTEESFKACVTNQKAWDAMVSVRERAVTKFDVHSTPTFFINGSKLVGAVSIDEMAKVIDPYLKG